MNENIKLSLYMAIFVILCSFVSANGGSTAATIMIAQEHDEQVSINALGLGPADYAINEGCKLRHIRGEPLNQFRCGDRVLIVNSKNEIVEEYNVDISDSIIILLAVIVAISIVILVGALIGYVIYLIDRPTRK